MSNKRWPVSDRDVKPWWFHALNYACAAILALAVVVIVLVALAGWASIL